MKPGRDLDAVIAERIFGRSAIYYKCTHALFCACPILPRYSTRMGDAWLVVNKLKESAGWGLHSLSSCCPHNTETHVSFCHDFTWAYGEGLTPSHAICNAALKATDVMGGT